MIKDGGCAQTLRVSNFNTKIPYGAHRLEQLQNWCYSSPWRCWRNSWTHFIQRNMV